FRRRRALLEQPSRRRAERTRRALQPQRAPASPGHRGSDTPAPPPCPGFPQSAIPLFHSHPTSMIKPFVITLGLVAAGGILSAQSPAAASDPYEEPPTLDAAAILQPAFAQGPHHRVRDPVPTYAGH